MSLYVKYLVCYDISNTRTRSKFFDFLKDLGLTPIQKSVFFGDLKTPEVRSLKAAAENGSTPPATPACTSPAI